MVDTPLKAVESVVPKLIGLVDAPGDSQTKAPKRVLEGEEDQTLINEENRVVTRASSYAQELLSGVMQVSDIVQIYTTGNEPHDDWQGGVNLLSHTLTSVDGEIYRSIMAGSCHYFYGQVPAVPQVNDGAGREESLEDIEKRIIHKMARDEMRKKSSIIKKEERQSRRRERKKIRRKRIKKEHIKKRKHIRKDKRKKKKDTLLDLVYMVAAERDVIKEKVLSMLEEKDAVKNINEMRRKYSWIPIYKSSSSKNNLHIRKMKKDFRDEMRKNLCRETDAHYAEVLLRRKEARKQLKDERTESIRRGEIVGLATDVAQEITIPAQAVLAGPSLGPDIAATDMMNYAMSVAVGGTALSQIGSQMRINNDVESGNAILTSASYLIAPYKTRAGTSTARVYARLYLMMASQSMFTYKESELQNLYSDMTDAYPDVSGPFVPLSEQTTVAPEIDMCLCTYNEYVSCVIGTDVPAEAAFAVENWNVPGEYGVAIVPVRSTFANHGKTNWAWMLAFMEAPYYTTFVEDIDLFNLDDEQYNTTGEMQPVTSRIRIAGPVSRVIFVICNMQQTHDCQLRVGNGAGLVTLGTAQNLLTGASVTMGTPAVTHNCEVMDRTDLGAAVDVADAYFGSTDDKATAFAFLSDVIGMNMQGMRQIGAELTGGWMCSVDGDTLLGTDYNVLAVSSDIDDFQTMYQTASGVHMRLLADVQAGQGDLFMTTYDHNVYCALMGKTFSYVNKVAKRGRMNLSSLFQQAYIHNQRMMAGADYISAMIGLPGAAFIADDDLENTDRMSLVRQNYESKIVYWMNLGSSSSVYSIRILEDGPIATTTTVSGKWWGVPDNLASIGMVRINPRWMSYGSAEKVHCTSTWIDIKEYGYTTLEDAELDRGDRLEYTALGLPNQGRLQVELRKIMTQALAGTQSGALRTDLSGYKVATKQTVLYEMCFYTGIVGNGQVMEAKYNLFGLVAQSDRIDLPWSVVPMTITLDDGQKEIALWIDFNDGSRRITGGVGTIGRIIYYKEARSLDMNSVDRDTTSVDGSKMDELLSFL